MGDETSWADGDLLRAFEQYLENRSALGLSPATIKSDTEYGMLFLRWRSGDYLPRACPSPIGRPVPARKRDLGNLRAELGLYESALLCGITPDAIPAYLGTPRRFLDWLGGTPGVNRGLAIPRPKVVPRSAIVPSRGSTTLTHEFSRIRESHHQAIVRTVARAALPSSVSRVFAAGTAASLAAMLPSLALDELPKLSDQAGYRKWFEAALKPVADTILRLNPPELRPGIHPGFKWGHATKVLSLFARDVVTFSRYFTDADTAQIERWLYCPIDGIVIDRLRKAGFDPQVALIRELDERRFCADSGRPHHGCQRSGSSEGLVRRRLVRTPRLRQP